MEPDHPLVPLHTIVNGQRVELEVDPKAAAADVIRKDLNLTGTKLVCGAGVCGACTVIIDGKPATSCTLPACSLEASELRTVESVAEHGLHPVQKAFLVHDGLQCGYCTPGFIVEAVAFFDRWRETHGKSDPPRDTIAYALSGHLCRCGAYVGIYDAVAAACRGDFDGDDPIDYPRHEGEAKVTGQARYTSDLVVEDMLIAKYLCSPHAHTAIERLNFEPALAIEGVEAVIEVLEDEHRVARYAGQPIAAVAAVDEATAQRALAAIEVDYAPRGFVVDPKAALAEGAPEVFPEKKKHPKNASEGPIPPGRWDGNLRTPVLNKLLQRKRGRAEKDLARARAGEDGLRVVEGTFYSGGQTHSAFEPHGALARWTDDGRLIVHTGTQSVHMLTIELAEHYKLKMNQVSVRSEFVGGAFGAKQSLQLEHTAAADLAKQTGRPVKLINDREQEMVSGGYRPQTEVEIAAVTNADLEPLGLTVRAYGTAGVAVQSQVALMARLTYAGPKHVRDFDIVTNTGPGRPMRGPSGPPAFWAIESTMDQLAHEAGADPIALRRKWEDSDVRDRLYDWVESLPVWQQRTPTGQQSGRFRTGVGVAIGNWTNPFNNSTRVQLDATPDGLVARCGVQDMGNGARSVITKAIGDTFGISHHDVGADIGRSELPEGPAASGSRATASIYPTALEAAEMMQKKLLQVAKRSGLERPTWEPGGIRHGGGFTPLAEFLRELAEPLSVLSNRRGGNSTFDLLGAMPSGKLGVSLYGKMTGSIAVMQVEVDTKLGRVRPLGAWIGMSAGKIVNPELARSQTYGAVVQSIGIALTEERHYDPHTGRLLSSNLEDHRIPGIGDIPPIEIFFDESGFTGMKGGACGIAELSTLAPPAALGNAVFNATGWRPRAIPIRPQVAQRHLAHLTNT